MSGWTGCGGRRRWEAVVVVAEGHPVDPVHPVCGGDEDRMAGWGGATSWRLDFPIGMSPPVPGLPVGLGCG